MKILITGNMGYVGPCVVRHLRQVWPNAVLVGLDAGFFSHYLTNAEVLPESRLDAQYFGDIRRISGELLADVDAIVHLAAISNDPMGNHFEDVTMEINHRASVRLAWLAKASGVRSFVYASSCSVYGFTDEGRRDESSALNPLTEYAKSKVLAEQDLALLADKSFKVTCLRFATACGMSDRLRLDLVLNDFVASALTSGEITVLSDGTPYRPLINVKDMARAVEWAVARPFNTGGNFLVVNTGSDQWNYRIRDLAEAVADVIPSTRVSINPNAQPDKRSYRVDFGLFCQLAPDHQPHSDLLTTIADLSEGLRAMGFRDRDFRNSHLTRLKVLSELCGKGLLNDNLEWQQPAGCGSAIPLVARAAADD